MKKKLVPGKAASILYERATQLARDDGPKDKVFDLLKEAAALGSAAAFRALGDITRRGVYSKANPKKAASYFRRAANLGNAEGAFDYAVSAELGSGIVRNEETAFRYFLLSTLLGDINGAFEVYRCFFWGIGTKRDRKLAQAWASFFDNKGQFAELKSRQSKKSR